MARLRIGELCIHEGLITRAELDEVLTAQQIYGGRLGTNLVEHGLVSEDELARVLAAQLGMPRVSREDLAAVPPWLIESFPKAIALRFSVVPYRFVPDPPLLWLAMADPNNLGKQDEIQFVLGRRVELALCPELVLARALEKYYGVARDVRFIKLDTGARRERPVPAGGALLSRIVSAATKEELLDTVAASLTAFAGKVLFLVADGAELRAWSGRGIDCSSTRFQNTAIPLGASEVVRMAFATCRPVALDRLAVAGLSACQDLGMQGDGAVVVVPLVVGDRACGIYVLGDLVPGRTVDPTLLSELMRRVGWRLQALQLMEHVAAPLAGLP